MRRYDADAVGDALIKVTNAHKDKSIPELIKLVIKELNKFVDDKVTETNESDTEKKVLSKLLKVFNSVSSPEQLESATKYHDLVLKKLNANSLHEFYGERGEIGDLALEISNVISNKEKKYTPVGEGQIYSTGGGAGQSYRKFTPKVDKTLDEDWGSSDWTAALKDFKRDLAHVKNADDIADSAYSIASSFSEPRKYSDDPWTSFTPKRLLDMALRRDVVPKELISTVQGILSGKIAVRIAHELDEEVLINRLSQESSVIKGLVAEGKCPKCGGPLVSEEMLHEKKDACYYKVKSRYKVWPSAYASGALVKCRKKGAKNWGNKSVKENKGLPMPGTYEQEYNMFKSKGPERIIAMTNEADAKKTFVVVYYSKKTDRNVTKQVQANNESEVWDALKSKGIQVVSVTEKEVKEAARTFQSKASPLEKLIQAYGYFTTLGNVHLDKQAKTPEAQQALFALVQRLNQDGKVFAGLDKVKMERNREQILSHIHDMMTYAIPVLKKNLPADAWEAKRGQINSVLQAYNDAAGQNQQGVTEGKKRKKKKTSRSLGRYFFPGYAYYGGGGSGESGGGDGGGGESINHRVSENEVIKLSPRSQKAKDWIAKVYAKYPGTWQNNHVMTWGEGDDQELAFFELVPSLSSIANRGAKGAVEIKWFQAYPLRKGIGSRAIKELQQLAREDNITLVGYPWDKGTVSQKNLMKFYMSHGFKPTTKGGKNLIWEPQGQDVTEGDVIPFKSMTWESIPKEVRQFSAEWYWAHAVEDGPEMQNLKQKISLRGFNIDYDYDGENIELKNKKTGKVTLLPLRDADNFTNWAAGTDPGSEINEDLRKWFKEKWVRFGPDGKIRGDCARGSEKEGKPKCLPQSKAHALGKKGRKYAANKKRREDPNPERSGKAINVATKKKSNEGVTEGLDPDTQRLEQEVRDALANGDDYTAKSFAKMAQTAADRNYLRKIIRQEMYGTGPGQGGVAENSLTEFAGRPPGGDDGEEFDPEIAKLAQEDGLSKGVSLSDHMTLVRAMAIQHWHTVNGGMYIPYFAKGFKKGRMDKINHANTQYNRNLKLMKDGSIRDSEQGVAEGEVVPFVKKKKVFSFTKNQIIQLKALCQTALELSWENHLMPTAYQGPISKLSPQEQKQIFDKNEAQIQSLGYNYLPDYTNRNTLFLHSIEREAWWDDDKPPEDYYGPPDLKYDAETNTLSYYNSIRDKDYEYTDSTQFESLREEEVTEKWSAKYKRSINCNNPKGFSQRAHCQGRKKKGNK